MRRQAGHMMQMSRTLFTAALLLEGCTRPSLVSAAYRGNCRVDSTLDTQVTLDSGPVFIEPNAVVKARRGLLLAGSPTYSFSRSPEAVEIARNNIFGVIIGSGGRAKTVPAPIQSDRIQSIRAIAIPDGRWAATFAEQAPRASMKADDSPVEAYWFGITDGDKWDSLTRLPSVNGELDAFGASRLVRAGNDLIVAVPFKQQSKTDIALFRYHAGIWSVATIPTGVASYVALDALSADESNLLVVQPDTTESDDTNSLFLYSLNKNGSVKDKKLIARGGHEPIHDPRLRMSRLGTVVSWGAERRTERALRLRAKRWSAGSDDPTSTMELASTVFDYVSVSTDDGRTIFVVQHDVGPQKKYIELFTPTDVGSVKLGEITNPFTGLIGATWSDGKLLLVGPVVSDRTVSSHLITATLACDSISRPSIGPLSYSP